MVIRIFRAGFGPLLPECVEVPFNDLAALEQALASRTVAAFFVEPIQGKGVTMPDDGYLQGAFALCRKYGTLFVADEIQTGLGRTGRFLACEHWGIEPDMVLARQGLVGRPCAGRRRADAQMGLRQGLQLDGPRGRPRIDVLEERSRHGGRPRDPRSLESERLIERSAQLGERLLRSFETMSRRHELIRSVRGKGLMIGIEFGPPRSPRLRASWNLLETASSGLFCQLIVIPLFNEHKLLTQVAGHGNHTIKLLPSLVLSEADCGWIERSFDTVIAGAHRTTGAVWKLGKTLVGNAVRARSTPNCALEAVRSRSVRRGPSRAGAQTGMVAKFGSPRTRNEAGRWRRTSTNPPRWCCEPSQNRRGPKGPTNSTRWVEAGFPKRSRGQMKSDASRFP